MNTTVTIDGKEYTLSLLRAGQLRRIDQLLKQKKDQPDEKKGFAELDMWMPFLKESIQRNHPEFSDKEMDDISIPEFREAWQTLVNISGVSLVPKGEAMPTEKISNGQQSTADSPAPSVSRIV